MWSIVSKCTSYVAIDRTTAKQHETPVREAAAAEITQLTRARYQTPKSIVFTFDLDASNHLKRQDSDIGGHLESLAWAGSIPPSPRVTFGAREDSPTPTLSSAKNDKLNPTKEAARNGDAHEEKPIPEVSLDKILYTQTAGGEFRLCGTGLDRTLLEKCQTNVLEQFMDFPLHKATAPAQSSQEQVQEKGQVQGQDAAMIFSLHLNILAIVYTTDHHANSKALWELQVSKARLWIRQTIKALLGREDAAEISLEELKGSIIE
ncbi:hypothetical protein BDW69DRAFT_182828 [Aspergillus filifer]